MRFAYIVKHLTCAAVLLMLISGGAAAEAKVKKSVNKNSEITIKRGVVVNSNSFNEWESGSQHPRRFKLSPTRKP